MQQVEVIWAGDLTTQPSAIHTGERVTVQMFHQSPVGPNGGRMVKIRCYTADGTEIETVLYSEVYRLIRRSIA